MSATSPHIAMRTRRRDLAAELRATIGQLRIETVGEYGWRALQDALAPISDHRLRELLRAVGLPLAPLVEGVRVSSFGELQRTLLAILTEYERAAASGDVERQRACRRVVIAAKDRTRLGSLSARNAGRREEMREMVEWMLVWLENPPVFPQWVALRLRAKGAI